jgi:hypothetical protein
VSHLRPGEKVRRNRAACRKGRHSYGASQNVGAGIVRRVCDVCSEVTIDLTQTADAAPTIGGHRLTGSETAGDA